MEGILDSVAITIVMSDSGRVSIATETGKRSSSGTAPAS